MRYVFAKLLPCRFPTEPEERFIRRIEQQSRHEGIKVYITGSSQAQDKKAEALVAQAMKRHRKSALLRKNTSYTFQIASEIFQNMYEIIPHRRHVP